jgi:hypothetical protein
MGGAWLDRLACCGLAELHWWYKILGATDAHHLAHASLRANTGCMVDDSKDKSKLKKSLHDLQE